MDLAYNTYLPTTIVALFAIMGILSLPPVFLTATNGLDKGARRKIAFQTTVAVAITMLVSLLIGGFILDLFKINIDAFKIAGALVVASMAWGMIVGRPSTMMDTHGKSPAVIPLAIPKTAGPGAIATVIALGSGHSASDIVLDVIAIIVVTALALGAMLGSSTIERTLGANGLNILSRVFGLILLAIALTSVLEALNNFFPAWSS